MWENPGLAFARAQVTTMSYRKHCNRNDVLKGKKILIGCGGGYHQECAQDIPQIYHRIELFHLPQISENRHHFHLFQGHPL